MKDLLSVLLSLVALRASGARAQPHDMASMGAGPAILGVLDARVPRDLSSFYGTRFPAGGMVFLRLRPPPA